MAFRELLEDVGANQQHEVADLATTGEILIAEGVEDDAAVDVDVAAQRVALQGVARIDHR